MNKQQLIEKAVNVFSGKWPSKSDLCVYMYKFESENVWECVSSSFDGLFTKEEFSDTAKRMGYINGYEWGNEYPINGKKPDLPDDMAIEYVDKLAPQSWSYGRVIHAPWAAITLFRITDSRYKPESESAPAKHWFEAGELPPVGWHGECAWGSKVNFFECVILPNMILARKDVGGDWVVLPLGKHKQIEFRPIKTDKENFIETALSNFDEIRDQFPPAKNEWLTKLFGQMFDAGFKVPDPK